jgi:hypothetical protein
MVWLEKTSRAAPPRLASQGINNMLQKLMNVAFR